MFKKIAKKAVEVIDILLFFVATLVLTVTMYCLNWIVGGIVLTIALIAWGIITEHMPPLDKGGGK